MEGTALDCRSCLGRGGRRGQRWRSGVRLLPRGAGRRKFPEGHLRSRRRPLLQVRAPAGPGREARAGRWRRRGASKRRAAARAVRTRPRGGTRAGGGGKRTPCVANAKDLTPAASDRFPLGNKLWRPWETFISSLRRMQVGSFVVALPRLCIRPPGHFVVTGLSRRRARCITCFAAHLSILGATPAQLCRRVSRGRPWITRVNSEKSRTYVANVVRPIIEAKRKPAQTPARGANKAKQAGQVGGAAAPAAKPRQRPAAAGARVKPAPPALPLPTPGAEAAPVR